MITDSQLLDYLEQEVMDGGPLLLHDGYADCGRNRGLAFRPNLRTLRQSIAAMMPQRKGSASGRGAESPVHNKKGK